MGGGDIGSRGPDFDGPPDPDSMLLPCDDDVVFLDVEVAVRRLLLRRPHDDDPFVGSLFEIFDPRQGRMAHNSGGILR
jgi:hypothetical protein